MTQKTTTHKTILPISHNPTTNCLDMGPGADQTIFRSIPFPTVCTTGSHQTNTYNITITYPTPQGGQHQEKNITPLSGEKEMEQLLEEYRLFLGSNYRKKNTQIRYYNSAEKYLNYIQELNQEWTQRYIAHLHQTMRHNSVVSNIVGLNRFLEHINRQDLRIRTPNWQQITRDTIRREDIIKIVQHARKHYHYMDYLILLFIRDLDTRNHEIIKAQWNWIHGDKIQFQDCKTGDTTGRLTPELTEALQNWRSITPYPDNPYIFHIPHGPYKGQPMSSMGWYIRSLINRISIEVVGRRLNPQDLRASVITAEYTAYVNPKIIQLKARHRSEKTTMRYNHVDEELIQEYIQHGTIFTTDTEPVSSVLTAKPEVAIDNKRKRGYINTYPEDSLKNEDEDNTCYSFSYFLTHISGWNGVGCSPSNRTAFALLSPPYQSIMRSSPTPHTPEYQCHYLMEVMEDGGGSDRDMVVPLWHPPLLSFSYQTPFFIPHWGPHHYALGCVRFSYNVTSVKQSRYCSRLFLVHTKQQLGAYADMCVGVSSQIPQKTNENRKVYNTIVSSGTGNDTVPETLYILYIYYTFRTRGFFFGE